MQYRHCGCKHHSRWCV